MILRNYINFFLLVVGLLFSKFLFALYPDADPYPYKKSIINTYIGFTLASTVSETFGTYGGNDSYNIGNKDRYQALWNPSHMFDAYMSSFNIGVRFADSKNTFLNNLRFEAQYINTTTQFNIIADTDKVDPESDKQSGQDSSKITAGYEYLKHGMSLLISYDIRSWSQTLYPYLGVGVGIGTFEYINVDITEYDNGKGERYKGEKRMPFGQASLGLAYENKFIKSSFFIEYKFLTTFTKMTLNPGNDGYSGAKDPIKDPKEEQKTKPRDVSFMMHGIAFGIRFNFS